MLHYRHQWHYMVVWHGCCSDHGWELIAPETDLSLPVDRSVYYPAPNVVTLHYPDTSDTIVTQLNYFLCNLPKYQFLSVETVAFSSSTNVNIESSNLSLWLLLIRLKYFVQNFWKPSDRTLTMSYILQDCSVLYHMKLLQHLNHQ